MDTQNYRFHYRQVTLEQKEYHIMVPQNKLELQVRNYDIQYDDTITLDGTRDAHKALMAAYFQLSSNSDCIFYFSVRSTDFYKDFYPLTSLHFSQFLLLTILTLAFTPVISLIVLSRMATSYLSMVLHQIFLS